MSEYSEKLKDPRWQKKRLEIFQRDGWACRGCGAAGKTLHVHHCHYEGCDPWDAMDEILLTLCEDCHQSRGELEADAKLALGKIMARLPNHSRTGENLMNFVSHLFKAAMDDRYPPLVVDAPEYEPEDEDEPKVWLEYEGWDSDGRWYKVNHYDPRTKRGYWYWWPEL